MFNGKQIFFDWKAKVSSIEATTKQATFLIMFVFVARIIEDKK